MVYLQRQQVDEYLNHKLKTKLSLETQVFLSLKHRTPNRYKLLDKLIRASITPKEELTEKTVYLGEKAKKLLRAILKKLFLNQVKSICSTSELDIESVEYVVENSGKNINNSLPTKETIELPILRQDVWEDICRQLIEKCGVHVYNNWFSKLTPVIDKQNSTIELKAPNSFVQQEVTTRYRNIIKEVSNIWGIKFKGIDRYER